MACRTSDQAWSKVETQVHAVNRNSRTSNCQCNLFSKKNPIIRIFCISGWLAVPIKPDKWSLTVCIICMTVRTACDFFFLTGVKWLVYGVNMQNVYCKVEAKLCIPWFGRLSVWDWSTVGCATTNDGTTKECYHEQFLSVKSGCYNEHVLQRTRRNTISRRSTHVRITCRAFRLWLER
jgi:hypothetical protein